jgi:energy-coupling factor transporter ATP-binding protein EcfA2
MPKRKTYNQGFFPLPNAPLERMLYGTANIVVNYGFQRLAQEAAKAFGIKTDGLSPEDECRLNYSKATLLRQQVEIERIRGLTERQIRLLDIRIMEREDSLERARHALDAAKIQQSQLQLPQGNTIVVGALEVAADPSGFDGSPEQAESYTRWLDGFQEGKVVLVTGRRGSGKTALIAKMAEYMSAVYQMPTYWLGLPDEARKLLPTWVTMIDDAYKCPVNSFIVCDEAGINFLSLLFQDQRNQFMRRLLMVCRQRHCSLAFAVQNTKDVDIAIVRQADSIIFKQPGLHQPETERADVKPIARKAAEIFAGMSKDEALASAFVADDDFQGVLKFTPPTFWSEALSHVYAHLDLMAVQREVEIRRGLTNTITATSHQIAETSLETQILKLRRDGHGVEAIAKMLSCSTYRVRKALEGADNGG